MAAQVKWVPVVRDFESERLKFAVLATPAATDPLIATGFGASALRDPVPHPPGPRGCSARVSHTRRREELRFHIVQHQQAQQHFDRK